ncbi:TetR/AcrR family transcriptional regulator [Streptomyces sp. O3]
MIDDRTDKRTAVLDAALALFTERTFAATPMPLVAERARVGMGTVYRYFPNKEALGNAVHQRAKVTMLAYLTVDGGYESIRAEFGAVWRGLAHFARDHPDAFVFLEHQQHEHYLDADSRALSARIEELALDLTRRGQAVGEIRPAAPHLLVALVFGAFVGLVKTVRSAGAALSDEDIAVTETATWDLLHSSAEGNQP